MTERALIFGNGYLGNKFKNKFQSAAMSLDDITDALAVRAALDQHKPAVVINCAGKTGKPNVDWCEDHKEETFSSNVTGPFVLARECLSRGIFFTHIGSGCVYEGDNKGKGFSEDDAPNFSGSYYSRTKMLSEQGLKEFPVLQLRLRMPADSIPGPRNLITKIASYKKVISVPNSISIIDDFLTAAEELIKRRRTGIYNVTNPGAIEHKEILDAYKKIVNPNHEYQLIGIEELSKITKAGRSNCVLNTSKLKSEGITLPDITEAIPKILEEYKKKI